MTKLNGLFGLLMVFLTLSCNMSAKNEKDTKEASIDTATKGEVVVLDRAEFLTKVFNYEENTAEWKYEGNKPCIIDFYADWCPPCKKIAPILKELAAEYADDIIVYKIDADKETELAATFGIQALPTLLFIPNEGIPTVSMGALSKDQFVQQINEVLLMKE